MSPKCGKRAETRRGVRSSKALVIANFLKITEDGPDAIGVVGRIPSVLNF